MVPVSRTIAKLLPRVLTLGMTCLACTIPVPVPTRTMTMHSVSTEISSPRELVEGVSRLGAGPVGLTSLSWVTFQAARSRMFILRNMLRISTPILRGSIGRGTI
jgi:hypothetical protein